MKMITLDSKVNALEGVGKTLLYRLRKIKIETLRDLIFYYPFRYDDFSQFATIDALEVGTTVTICGTVELLANKRTPRKRVMITEALVTDETGSVKIVWFNQPWIGRTLKIGDQIYVSGKVAGNMFDVFFNSPTYQRVTASTKNPATIIPIYSVTDGITQKNIQHIIRAALSYVDQIQDFLPEKIIKNNNLIGLRDALEKIHGSKNKAGIDLARKRLSFDELFVIQLASQLIKKKFLAGTAPAIKFYLEKTKQFIATLGFELTVDQKAAAWEILKDMQKANPTNRLIEGDVGSGKTVVALIALYNVFLNKCQGVFMAPTEILAFQHYATCRKYLPKEVAVGILTRTTRMINNEKVSKADFLAACKKGKIDVIIGTHAVIQKDVVFKKLALAIIDEQHRFGVGQREQLQKKGKDIPHFVSLTATPIPRSLALTLYGDLDISIIKQMPSGRKKSITKIVAPQKRRLAYDFIAKQIESGRQVFIICPLIDPSDTLGVRSVREEFERLDKEIFPDITVGLLHGRLKSQEKEDVLNKFSRNEVKILVSTSVVEVGIDVPNATVMMIEGAERFGLAQLHQFRGRVGRGEHQSYCFLFSTSDEAAILDRLQSLVDCHDGFILAQRDLEMRGAGSLYGYNQSGFMDLKIADLKDLELIKKTRQAAQDFVEYDDIEKYPLLQERVNALGFSDHLE